MSKKKKINRRKFVGNLSTSAAAFTIVPRHVLGKGFIAPSDKITVANIGCGTQGIYEMPDLLQNENIQVTAVCDVNKYTTDYKDWSNLRVKNTIRKTIGDKTWGQFIKGIPAGRDIGQDFVDKYYSSTSTSVQDYKACRAYEDYRELLEKETDVDVIKIMTPDHSHGCIALASMKKTHLLAWEDKPEYRLIKQWIADGVIGKLKEIHNWSFRPVWPQYFGTFEEEMKIPDGFNWQLWLGPEKDRPYHLNYTHNVFRGWYDFGGGSIADMGHYSLFPLFRELDIDIAPTSVRSYGSVYRTAVNGVCRAINNDAAFPYSSMIKFQFPEQKTLPAFSFHWYDGGMKPFAPEELEREGKDVAPEGMMFVGSEGKILAGFQGEYAKTITELVNLGAAALRANRRINYDSDSHTLVDDKSADKFLARDYREGWQMTL